jgi:hypothetical protein
MKKLKMKNKSRMVKAINTTIFQTKAEQIIIDSIEILIKGLEKRLNCRIIHNIDDIKWSKSIDN